MKWRIDSEWAWQEISANGERRLANCIAAIQGNKPFIPSDIGPDISLMATLDEMAGAEVLFRTGLTITK